MWQDFTWTFTWEMNWLRWIPHNLAITMATKRRRCRNDSDDFWVVCGEFTTNLQYHKLITDFVKIAYFNYSGVDTCNQTLVRNTICQHYLRQWSSEKRSALKYRIPIIWREPSNHYDYYFCALNVTGINSVDRNKWRYSRFFLLNDLWWITSASIHTRGRMIRISHLVE